MIKCVFILTALLVGLNAFANTEAQGGMPVNRGKFEITKKESREAVCDMFDYNGKKIETKSMLPPGCVLELQQVEVTGPKRKGTLGLYTVYVPKKMCGHKPGDLINTGILLSECERPEPHIFPNKKYCDVADFKNPKRIKDYQWACMIGRVWSVAPAN
jgi:hypothetical protein